MDKLKKIRCKRLFKSCVYVSVLAHVISCTVMFTIVFIRAYFRDAKISCININDYGEANMEAVMFLVLTPLTIIALVKFIKDGGIPREIAIKERYK